MRTLSILGDALSCADSNASDASKLFSDTMFDDQRNSPNASPEEQQGAPLLAALPGYPSRDPTPLPRPIGSGATPMSMSASVSGNSLGGNQDVVEDLRQARREIELLKSMVSSHF